MPAGIGDWENGVYHIKRNIMLAYMSCNTTNPLFLHFNIKGPSISKIISIAEYSMNNQLEENPKNPNCELIIGSVWELKDHDQTKLIEFG